MARARSVHTKLRAQSVHGQYSVIRCPNIYFLELAQQRLSFESILKRLETVFVHICHIVIQGMVCIFFIFFGLQRKPIIL